MPEEFSYDPVSKTYGDPQRRPEIKSSTIEFIAPSEYMVRIGKCALVNYLVYLRYILTNYRTNFLVYDSEDSGVKYTWLLVYKPDSTDCAGTEVIM